MMTKFQDEITNNANFLDATLKGYRDGVLRAKEERDLDMKKVFQEMTARLAEEDASRSPSMGQ
jgi:hypothetical protein